MLKKVFLFICKLLLLALVLITAFITAVNYDIFGHIYTSDELKEYNNQQASVVLANDNTVLGKFFEENRTNVQYNELPQHLIDALVATEDARYFEHSGVDTKSLFRVLFKTLLQNNKRSGGGSTITQQLAKNMYGRKNYGALTMLVNKTKEGIQAYRLEQTFTKEEIVTLYLNTVSFGENVFGIEAAALRYFNKTVENLSTEESAVLVGILKANTYYNPRLYPDHALKRRAVVLQQMQKYEYIDKKELDSLNKLPLNLNYSNLGTNNKAGYFLAEVKNEAHKILNEINNENDTNWSLETDGLVIKTTLDFSIQQAAVNAFKQHLKIKQKQLNQQFLKGSNKTKLVNHINKILKAKNLYQEKFKKSKQLIFDWNEIYSDSISVKDSIRQSESLLHAGLLAMNPKTGAIKSWVGGINHNLFPYDQIHAQRQLASAFKPIVYATALEKGISPCEYLENEKITLTEYKDWSPENANKKEGGKYSMTGSLINSLNIPTVNLFLKTGFKSVDTLWKKMKFTSQLENKPSTALGTGSASIYQVTQAYSAFANNGEMVSPYFISEITNANGTVLYKHRAQKKETVLSAKTTKVLNKMLQKAIDSGTGKKIRNTYKIKLPLAGKTGTSQNYADAWFVAYNPDLVITSRVGCNSPTIHFSNGNGSGSSLALPLVAKTLQKERASSYSSFPKLTEDELEEINCPDFKEKTGIEKFFDIFKRKEKSYEKEQRKLDRKEKKRKRKSR